MKTSENGFKLIKNFEGLRTEAYICSAGLKTIGYGHVLSANDNRHTITVEEAENLLAFDVNLAELAVLRNIRVELRQNQFDALVSFTFNVGPAALQRSTLRQKINRNEHDEAKEEFLRWIYTGKGISSGLIKRRKMESELYALI